MILELIAELTNDLRLMLPQFEIFTSPNDILKTVMTDIERHLRISQSWIFLKSKIEINCSATIRFTDQSIVVFCDRTLFTGGISSAISGSPLSTSRIFELINPTCIESVIQLIYDHLHGTLPLEHYSKVDRKNAMWTEHSP